MKVLILGGGGREHALAWKIRKSQHVNWVGCAPGNAGTSAVAEPVDLTIDDPDAVAAYVRNNDIALTVIGPEAPLAAGVADTFAGIDHLVFGPSADAARLETSKRWSKEVMASAGVPTAGWRGFRDAQHALRYVRAQQRPLVIKASGLAAGKGVFVCETTGEAEQAVQAIMIDKAYGDAGDEIIVEQRLTGTEASLLAVCDGETHMILAPARDHKRIGEGDSGPNTGGMGAIAPNPEMTDELVRWASDQVFAPILRELNADGTPYKGVLYAGLMLTEDGPKVLEFNARFGDPETQVILPLLNVDVIDLMLLCADGRLGEFMTSIGLESHQWRRLHRDAWCATVVLASEGYPVSYEKGKEITGAPDDTEDSILFHAGTKRENGKLLSSGGRVLNATAVGDTRDDALNKAYELADQVQFEGKYLRRDIGGFAGYPPKD